MRPARGLAVVLASLVASGATAGASAAKAPVDVSIDRTQVSTRLGESFSFSSTVENTGAQAQSGLVAHLNVAGLSKAIYVDPEDWSEERIKFLAPLAPGDATTLDWNVKAVTGGRVAIYVVVLPERGDPAVTHAMTVRIADTKDLNSGGVLPLALGVPALLALATIAVRRRRRGP
jgi:hypothetical protein